MHYHLSTKCTFIIPGVPEGAISIQNIYADSTFWHSMGNTLYFLSSYSFLTFLTYFCWSAKLGLVHLHCKLKLSFYKVFAIFICMKLGQQPRSYDSHICIKIFRSFIDTVLLQCCPYRTLQDIYIMKYFENIAFARFLSVSRNENIFLKTNFSLITGTFK